MKHDDGGPAFPDPAPLHEAAPGMSLRDWFAGQALVGWLSGPCSGEVLEDYDNDADGFREHQQQVAVTCYGYADAMLAERAKERT